VSQSRNDKNDPIPSASGRIGLFRTMLGGGRSFSGREKHCVFLNTGSSDQTGRFADISATTGLDVADDGRAVAIVDWDHDGDLDLWISNRNAPRLRFFRNDCPSTNRFLSLRLAGNGKTVNRDAIGARVSVVTLGKDNLPRIKTLRAGEGFLAQSSKWMHFGLGQTEQVDRVVVHWPGGERETFRSLSANGRYQLTQGSGEALALDQAPRQLRLRESSPQKLAPALISRIPLITARQVPPLIYSDKNGRKQSANIGEGTSTLLTLWSSACRPCLAELTELENRADDLREANIAILAISIDTLRGEEQDVAAANNLLARLNPSFPVGDANERLLALLQHMHSSAVPSNQLLTLPVSFLIDAEGQLQFIYKGPLSIDDVIRDATSAPLSLRDRFVRSFPVPGQAIPHDQSDRIIADRHRKTLFSDAEALQKLGESQLAMRPVKRLLRFAPADARAHNLMGELLVGAQEFEQAVESFRSAVQFEPNLSVAHFNLGMALRQLDQTAEALPYLENAVRLDPMHYLARNYLGELLMDAGRLSEAEEHLQAASQLNPRGREVLRSLKRFRALKRRNR